MDTEVGQANTWKQHFTNHEQIDAMAAHSGH